jgi:hypothetical protein
MFIFENPERILQNLILVTILKLLAHRNVRNEKVKWACVLINAYGRGRFPTSMLMFNFENTA